jgi:hypothetical protein
MNPLINIALNRNENRTGRKDEHRSKEQGARGKGQGARSKELGIGWVERLLIRWVSLSLCALNSPGDIQK